MTKNEIIAHLSAKAEVTKGKAGAVLDALTDLVHVELRSGRDITIPEVGKFERKDRAARVGRNVGTGETLQIPAKRVPAFKAAKSLADAVA